LLFGCRNPAGEQQKSRQSAPAAPTTNAPQPVATVDIDDGNLDRQGVIVAALRATTAAALGEDDRARQAQLKGRQFALRIRFGCAGVTDPDRTIGYDAKQKVLRVKVQSNLTGDALPQSDLLRQGYEGAVGFTLGRPWLLDAGCPLPGFGSMAEGEPTIVIAQLFTDSDSRVQRPHSTFELTKPLEPKDVPKDGLNLLIAGRLAQLSDGRPIHCAAEQGPPACVVSARIDRVAIEVPSTGDVLGEWGNGAGPQ
jgi:hypothetical protein